jgi:hypothetical protein
VGSLDLPFLHVSRRSPHVYSPPPSSALQRGPGPTKTSPSPRHCSPPLCGFFPPPRLTCPLQPAQPLPRIVHRLPRVATPAFPPVTLFTLFSIALPPPPHLPARALLLKYSSMQTYSVEDSLTFNFSSSSSWLPLFHAVF